MENTGKASKAKKPFELQEHIEWIAMAFVLALTVRCFIVEAYQIPTGSMAPTLYGKHFEMTCPSCGDRFVVRGSDAGEYLVGFVCPACGKEDVPREKRLRLYGGDRILVAKDVYVFSKPRRWEVFVFKSPRRNDRTMTYDNFVKRLVGLPGESLEIRSGQIFIDGRIARKPEYVQRELWQPVYDSRNDAFDSPWRSNGGWTVKEGKLSLAEDGESWQTVEYTRPIVDFYAYNGRMGDNAVGDILVKGHVNIDRDQGSFSAAVYDDNHTIKAIFVPIAGRLEIELRKDEQLIRRTTATVMSPRDFDFSLATVDGYQEVRVDGRRTLYSVDDVSPDELALFTRSSGVFFGGYGTKLLVSDVEIKRDVYYTISLGRADRFMHNAYVTTIPEGNYFALGDNSPVSNDSRMWDFVPEANVLGKAFVLFWPPTRIKPVF